MSIVDTSIYIYISLSKLVGGLQAEYLDGESDMIYCKYCLVASLAQ